MEDLKVGREAKLCGLEGAAMFQQNNRNVSTASFYLSRFYSRLALSAHTSSSFFVTDVDESVSGSIANSSIFEESTGTGRESRLYVGVDKPEVEKEIYTLRY